MTALSIILLNYQKSELTIRCIASLVKYFGQELESGEFEVKIVDNKSPDDSVKNIKNEIAHRKYKNIELLENNNNLGFGGGCNYGARRSKGKYILFLNNDTIVADKGIAGMVDLMDKRNEIGILGGSLKNSDGTKQPSGGKFYNLYNSVLLLSGAQNMGLIDAHPTKIERVDWVKGALMMLRRKVFEKLNGFDENIFMYTEDMEICYRAQKTGFGVYFYPDINIIHQEQGSSNRSFAVVNICKNLLYFFKKHKSYPEYLALKTIIKMKALVLKNYGKITHNSYLYSTYEQTLKAIR